MSDMKEAGIGLVRLLYERKKNLRLTRFPSEEGINPVRLFD